MTREEARRKNAVALARDAFDEVIVPAKSAYSKAIAALRIEHEKATASAEEAYDEAVTPARATYDEAVDSAWSTYDKAMEEKQRGVRVRGKGEMTTDEAIKILADCKRGAIPGISQETKAAFELGIGALKRCKLQRQFPDKEVTQ